METVKINKAAKASTTTTTASSLFDFALGVYNQVTPPEQQPLIKLPDAVTKIDIRDSAALTYLDSLDKASLAKLNDIFAEAFATIIADKKITISDVPTVLKLIHNVSLAINTFNKKRTGVIEVTRLSVMSFLKITVIVLCQLYFPNFEVIFPILDAGFDLVQVNIDPVIKQTFSILDRLQQARKPKT